MTELLSAVRTRLTFVVPHPPVATGRPMVFGRRAVTPPRTAEAVRLIREYISERLPTGWEPITGPVEMEVTAVVAMPASIPKRRRATARPDRRPDVDNLAKTALDGCSPLWRDDAQVVRLAVEKVYGAPSRWEILVEVLG